MAKKIVLAGACRTAIGKMGGGLSTVPAATLGSIVIKEALQRAGVPADQVDHVYMGCVIQAGQGQNVARQASIKAGLPIECPAVTVNVVCGSGLNCVNMAAQMIQAGDADIVVAGGMENMSMAPFAIPNGRYGYRMMWPSQSQGGLVDTMVKDALWDAFNDYHMITTADNVAKEYGLTREELDEFEAELRKEDKKKSEQELGDFLFAVINAARLYKLNPDNALEMTNQKFIRRFDYIEQHSIRIGKPLKDMTLEEMDALWNEAKALENDHNE